MIGKTKIPKPTAALRLYVARIVDGAVVVGRCVDERHANRRAGHLRRQGQNPLIIRATSLDLAKSRAFYLYDEKGI